MSKVVSDRVAKRIARVQKDLETQYDLAFDRVHGLMLDLGFGLEYAELAATDIADDFMNGLVEGSPPEVPIWHEPDEEEEEREDELEEEEAEEDEVAP